MKVKGDDDQTANAATAAGQTRSPRAGDLERLLKEGASAKEASWPIGCEGNTLSCCDFTLSQNNSATAKIYPPSVTPHIKISICNIYAQEAAFASSDFLEDVIAFQNQRNQPTMSMRQHSAL
jgi:hypothetical protein